MGDLKDLFVALNTKPDNQKTLFDLIQTAIGNISFINEHAGTLSLTPAQACAFAVGALLLVMLDLQCFETPELTE